MLNLKLIKKFSATTWVFIILAVVSLVFLTLGSVVLGKAGLSLDKKIAEIEEGQRPADIDIIILQDSTCQDCYKPDSLLVEIKKQNVNVKSEEIVDISSAEGMELINKHNITKVPTLIVSGEIEKEESLKEVWTQLGEVKNGIFILKNIGAPYVLVSSGDVVGRIQLIMLADESCSDCYDVTRHETVLKQFGVSVYDKKIVDTKTEEGQNLIKGYKIELVPTIILIGDATAYPSLAQVWSQVGTVEEDGAYIFREGVKQMGIYKNLTTNNVITPTANQSNSQN